MPVWASSMFCRQHWKLSPTSCFPAPTSTHPSMPAIYPRHAIPVLGAASPTETRGPLPVSSRSHLLQLLLPVEARGRAVPGQPSWSLGGERAQKLQMEQWLQSLSVARGSGEHPKRISPFWCTPRTGEVM